MPYLTAHQTRLRDDIRGLVKGEVRCDEISLQLYATDAGILEYRPQGIVWPRDTDDIVACVKYASEKGISIHPRGAGTGVTGEALGHGIVLDLSHFMRRIISVDEESVLVQPGIPCCRLNSILQRETGRIFGPVAGFRTATTVGSVLARNGAGLHWLQHGLPSGHVLELKVVLADGAVLSLNRKTLPKALRRSHSDSVVFVPTVAPPHGPQSGKASADDNLARGIALARGIVHGREHPLADEIYRILTSDQHAAAIQPNLPVDRSGYHCQSILTGPEGRHVDLARLITGSEGTLGLIVEARLKTTACPGRAAAAMLFFNSFEKATAAVSVILPFQPSLCELVDRRRLSMVRDGEPRFQNQIPFETEAMLLVELDSRNGDADACDRLAAMLDLVQEKEKRCFHSLCVSVSPEAPLPFALFDDFLRRSELILFQMRRSFQAIPLFEDMAVPVPALQDFMAELFGVLRKNEFTASISGHVGQGHLRVHPLVNLSQKNFPQLLRRLADDVYRRVLDFGGTISSEYGTGLMKSHFIPTQHPSLIPTFQAIKKAFDPDNLFNPGKVLPEASPWTHHLRKGLAYRGMEHPDTPGMETHIWDPACLETTVVPPTSLTEYETETTPEDTTFTSQLELQLKWKPESVFEATHLCNGCGACFRSDGAGRMCPLFRVIQREAASPRASANLLRGVLNGSVELETLTHHRAKEIADACFHCGLCVSECPAEVNASLLAFRCKSAHVSAHGLALDDLLLSRLDSVLSWFAMASWPINWALGNPTMRWMLEKFLQIPQGSRIPKLTKVSFLNRVAWAGRHSKPQQGPVEKVALFVDAYANYFDSKLADLAIRILEHNGLSVYVPPRQRSSGLPAFAMGHMERAERLARHNSLLLADLIRQGFQVVTLEPTSASCMTQDYRYVVDDIDAALLSAHVVDLCHFLWLRHGKGKQNPDFRPISKTVGYHAPCRAIASTTRRVDLPTPAEELLRLIPDLKVHRIERGCCGMAGLFGMKQKNYRRSLQIGMPLFKELRRHDIHCAVSDCSACLLHIEHGSKKPGLHPILLLAVAYGLAPEMADAILHT